jgi:NADPH2:quinone reductase
MPKSIIIKKNGGPEVLELSETAVGSPGPDEIKVTNHAIGLNYIDTYHRSGLYPLTMPSGIGLEAAGQIDEIGSDVTEFNKGDNIAYASMPIGAYSQQRIIPAKIAVKVPDGISHELAATLMTKGLTTHYLICKMYKLKAGETILFHAAAGGVGQIFAQWANSIGAKVIGTVGSDEKIEIAKANGYSHVINYSKDDFAKEVMKGGQKYI